VTELVVADPKWPHGAFAAVGVGVGVGEKDLVSHALAQVEQRQPCAGVRVFAAHDDPGVCG
jgi:hypothetical protein